MKNRTKFKDFDWEGIARQLGGLLRRQTATEVEIAIETSVMRLIEVRGDLAIYRIEPLGRTIPYDDGIGDPEMVDRVRRAWNGEPIDFSTRFNEEVEDGEA